MTEEKKAVKYDFGLWEVGVGYDSCSGSVVRHPPPSPRIKVEFITEASANSSLFHLFISFIQHFSTGHLSPLCSVPPRRSCRPPATVWGKLLQLLPVPGSFFFLWERLRNACLLHSEGLAAGCPSLPLLPWQCCTVIDKVDKEMLGHAPDRLDLKSPRWGNGSSQTAYTKSPDNQRLAEEFGSSAGSGKNVIFCRFVFFGPSCLQCCRQISAYGRFSGCEREKKWELC